MYIKDILCYEQWACVCVITIRYVVCVDVLIVHHTDKLEVVVVQ